MELTTPINIERSGQSRIHEIDFRNLGFGKYFSDHMLRADYREGRWQEAHILPFGNISVSPSLSAFHHAQAIFEGMKAYRNKAGDVFLFRLMDNFNRMNRSAERMCMPAIPEEYFTEGIKTLLDIDKAWIPEGEAESLYIRPVYFATDTVIGVKPSEDYSFIVMTSPAGPYYTEPLKVWVETHYSRSAEGGTGYAKAAGNYGGAMYPSKLAHNKGYHQVIWTDSNTNTKIEEAGSMNIMFIIDGKLVTPSLSKSKLAGITRDSIITIAKDWGVPVEERDITVNEMVERIKDGGLTEAFGVGTAANISHIVEIGYENFSFKLPAPDKREFSNKMYKYLFSLKKGETEDKWGWVTRL